jgi:hypothetical protein
MNAGGGAGRGTVGARRGSRTLAQFCAVVFALLLVVGCGERDGASESGSGASDDSKWSNPGGRWHPVREGAFTDEQVAEMQKLKSIGYLAGSTRPPEVWGVTVYDSTRTWDGLNFYTSGHAPVAYLMDMRGNILHEWEYSFIDAWKQGPGGEPPGSSKGAGFWRRAYLFENGDVIAIYDGHAIIKIDRESRLIWARFGGFHHDLDVLPDGRIFTLLREPNIIPAINPEHPVLEEFIVVLDRDGNEIERVSQLDAIMRGDRVDLLEGMKDQGDIFHTNTIEVLQGRLKDRDSAFRRGNVLICIRELDNIAIVDMDARKVVWGLEGPWLKQHQPMILENGNMLIFDNGGSRGASRVLEFDPLTLEIVWVYKGDEENFFHSPQCGSNQRLPNGNTLISETDRGRAFEVTPDGTIVWEYINPAQAGDEGQFIASLFEAIRVSPERVSSWLPER